MQVTVSIGVPAYNEEGNIGNLLQSLTTQKLQSDMSIEEIIVAADGCTDQTIDIVKKFDSGRTKIELIVEEERKGHSWAINKIFENAKGNVVVLICADTVPTEEALSHLIEPLQKGESIGAVVGRAVPVNNAETFWGYVAHLTYGWLYLPEILMVDFEGMSAIRRDLFEPIPLWFINAEHYIDKAVRNKGFRVLHAQESVTFTRQPENLHDFLNQRKRNIFGHIQQKRLGINAPHIELRVALPLVLRSITSSPKRTLWISVMMVLWGVSYLLAWLDLLRGESCAKWEPINSGKKLGVDHERN